MEAVVDAFIFEKDYVLFTTLGAWLVLVLIAATQPVSRAVDYLLLALFFALVSTVWVFINSRRRSVRPLVGFVCAFLTFFFLPAGAVVYLLLRPQEPTPRPPPQKGRAVVFPVPVEKVFIPIRTPLGILLRLIAPALLATFFVLCVLAILGRIQPPFPGLPHLIVPGPTGLPPVQQPWKQLIAS